MIHKLLVSIDPRLEMARCFHKGFGRWPDFKNPKNLIEKIYWMQLNTDTCLWTRCADKYQVRQYVEEKGCNDILNVLYGVWNNAEEIDFSTLPSEFVLKTTNGCGQVLLVKNKQSLPVEETKKLLNNWLKLQFGYSGGELHYTRIKPRIIAERIIPNTSVFSDTIVDYKIWCINGEPLYIFVAYNRRGMKINMALFDTNWSPVPEYLKNTSNDIYNPDDTIPKPTALNEMLEYARKLSSEFKEVRVDFYELEGKPIFGELTFSTGFGYFTDEFYDMLGDKIKL